MDAGEFYVEFGKHSAFSSVFIFHVTSLKEITSHVIELVYPKIKCTYFFPMTGDA